MAKKDSVLKMRDIDRCKMEINCILEDYNCGMMDGEEGTHIILYDKDTGESRSALNK